MLTTEERETLWYEACKNLGFLKKGAARVSHRAAAIKLEEMLGVKEYSMWVWRARPEESPMPEKLRNLVKGLCGPHAKALLKAYRIRKGLE